MTALAKLRAGVLRRGRGNVSEEGRQAHDESLQQRNDIRAALLELDEARSVAITGAYDAGSSNAERYVPWGGTTSAAVGAPTALVALLPPYPRCEIVRIRVMSSTDPVSLRVRVKTYDETTEYDSQVDTGSAADVVETFEPGVTWTDGQPRLVSVDPASIVDEVAVIVTIREVPR